MPPDLFQRMYGVLRRVPAGRVVTYGQIARALGMPNGARTVGWAMHECPEDAPWYRVVNSKGETSLRGEGASLQRALLAEEGVVMDEAGRVNLKLYGWDEV